MRHNDPAQNTHSRSSSKKCPHHKKTKRELTKEAFNGEAELFTIKIGCERTCRIPGLQQQISVAADGIRNITYEATLLANRHFVRCMEERGVIEGNLFSQTFFYTCMQLVGGKNPERPPGLREIVFTDLQQTYTSYKALRPDDLAIPDAGPFWHALSPAAINMEKDARNHMVNNFYVNATRYIFFLLREAVDISNIEMANKDLRKLANFIYNKKSGSPREWPPSVEKVNGLEALVDQIVQEIDLGPTPVTDTTLFAKPHEYMPFFFRILRFVNCQKNLWNNIIR